MIFELLVIGVISFVAFLILGLSGFGSALILVPFLSLFLDIKLVVPATTLASVPVILFMLIKQRFPIKRDTLIVVFLGSLVGVIFGTYLLIIYDSFILKKVFGLSVIVFSLNMFKKVVHGGPIRADKYIGGFAGLLSGIVGALFGTGGPPAVIYFNRVIQSKDLLRSTILSFFLLSSIWRIINYTYIGMINFDSLILSLTLLPTAIIGVIVGSRICITIKESMFRKTLAIILLFTGISLLLT